MGTTKKTRNAMKIDVIIGSSVSSVINSLAAVCLEDFVSPAVFYFKAVELSDRIRRRIAVVLGAVYSITYIVV